MVVPREHGAWGMLFVPLATGAIVATKTAINFGALVLFVLAAMSLFWLRTPVESWLGTSAIKANNAGERRNLLRMIGVIGCAGCLSLAGLFLRGHNRGLLMIGAIAALAFAVQAGVKKLERQGRMPAQLIGAIGLTSTAAGAYYVATAHFDRTAFALWLTNWLFAADQIHFVQVRIHSSRAASFDEKLQQGFWFLLAQIGLIGVLLTFCRFGFLPASIAVAFLPVLLRGTLWFIRKPQPLNVHRLGFCELGHAIIFGALLCVTFLV